MSARSTNDEREWAADKREFVADRRDEVAAERDTVAQARETIADARDATLGQWDRRLVARADRSNMLIPVGAGQLADERAARTQGRRDRDEAATARDTAAVRRKAATTRRQADDPSLRLAAAFAAIAEHLYASDSYDKVLQRIAETAVSTVSGCDMASITVEDADRYWTAVTTDPDAWSVDKVQYEVNEGPSLDAMTTPVVHARAFPDGRWPVLAGQPTDFGVQSALSCGLGVAGDPAADAGNASLTSYGVVTDAFDDRAREIGLILAAHATVAARAFQERDALQHIEQHLRAALSSRDVIGQAKGILMERLNLPAEEAFDALRRSSQHLNEKLRDVARRIADTGQFDPHQHHAQPAIQRRSGQ
jgi:hypothetical protein